MLINWRNIENLLNKKYKKVASADGRSAYPPLPMFKHLLLQRWNNLSDPLKRLHLIYPVYGILHIKSIT